MLRPPGLRPLYGYTIVYAATIVRFIDTSPKMRSDNRHLDFSMRPAQYSAAALSLLPVSASSTGETARVRGDGFVSLSVGLAMETPKRRYFRETAAATVVTGVLPRIANNGSTPSGSPGNRESWENALAKWE